MKEQIEKQAIEEKVAELECDLQYCHREFVAEGEIYTDYYATAQNLIDKGYRKQIEGEWVAKDNFCGRCTIAICSGCGTEKAFPVLVKIETIATLYPYCQKCGARMKGGECYV